MAIEKTTEMQVFIPPREIVTEHLLIRPFASAEEEVACLLPEPKSDKLDSIHRQVKCDYYARQDVVLNKIYAGFVREEGNKFIGTIELFFDYTSHISSHERRLVDDSKGKGYGTELLSAILKSIVAPSIGKKVLLWSLGQPGGGRSAGDYIEDTMLGHEAQTQTNNYASLFSNIKSGMGVDIILYDTILMSYPAKQSALDNDLIRGVFKVMPQGAFTKTQYALRKNAYTHDVKAALQDFVLKVTEPYSAMFVACVLFKMFKEITDDVLLISHIKCLYKSTIEKSKLDIAYIHLLKNGFGLDVVWMLHRSELCEYLKAAAADDVVHHDDPIQQVDVVGDIDLLDQ